MLIYLAQRACSENILIKGGVGVLPTDTIYGLVGSALNKKVVKKSPIV